MAYLLVYLLTLLVLYLVVQVVRARRKMVAASRLPTPPASAPPPAPPASPLIQLYRLAADLSGLYEMSAHPRDLLMVEGFMAGVGMLGDDSYAPEDLLRYYAGDNAVIACLAMEALSRRPPDAAVAEGILEHVNTVGIWTRFFALRALHAHVPAPRPLVGRVLLRIDDSWTARIARLSLREFIALRLSAGEEPGLELAAVVPAQARFLAAYIRHLKLEPLAGMADGLDLFCAEESDDEPQSPSDSGRPLPGQPGRPLTGRAILGGVGKFWSHDRAEPAIVEHVGLKREVQELKETLAGATSGSVLLVGECGVGKTTIVRALGALLMQEGWTIFEAGTTEIVAGQRYFGDFEQRLQSMVRALMAEDRILWYVPDFDLLAWAGRHENNPNSALDFLLPHIEQGRIRVIGETRPDAFERLLLTVPAAQAALTVRRVAPLGPGPTLEVAGLWAQQFALPEGSGLASAPLLREAWSLVQHHLGHEAPPGNLLRFLDRTRARLLAAEAAPRPLRAEDFILTLAELTGLPQSLLDERHTLDVAELRALFERRVLGQPEAIECLVERVAMMKAGVTDPTRAQGVFLFAGPTGTGKTEIAKTLATFLFGSPERMIRLDMSELQTYESIDRILGTAGRTNDPALVEQIRRQPFSVVLLDEFEKAHPRVWDLFLQVFDDGRLTDRRGNRADFRHAIIIMTTNLGGRVPDGKGLGFTSGGASFQIADARKAIEGAFRKEFLNRIDRMVVFQPLSREIMRSILRKELDDMTQRRGLRNRGWAIEWGDDALEFLLTKGFTVDLGARPLKRAIERYLLSPLAMTIVTHQYPQGDQFLFVRAEGDRLAVQFVDPDAGAAADPPTSGLEGGEALRIERIAFEPRGTAGEIASLRAHFEGLTRRVDDEEWRRGKRVRLARMTEPGFWDSDARFRTLGDVEYLDRIEQGVAAAGSLLDRLLGSEPRHRQHFPRDLVGRLAERLFVLEAACAELATDEPRDAFLLVEAGQESPTLSAPTNAFAARLGAMYQAWARRRGMDLRIVTRMDGSAREPYRLLLALSGYAAWGLLRAEAGLHYLESAHPQTEEPQRVKVRVRVVPQPEEPAGRDDAALRLQAETALGADGSDGLVVVRRYRDTPPLARDSVRGWRTGRLDRVFGGDFDLIAGALSAEEGRGD